MLGRSLSFSLNLALDFVEALYLRLSIEPLSTHGSIVATTDTSVMAVVISPRGQANAGENGMTLDRVSTSEIDRGIYGVHAACKSLDVHVSSPHRRTRKGGYPSNLDRACTPSPALIRVQ
ncbi:hypothetical protein B0H67DRAFT_225137 [Lasiosphaeris hirsuta]|uniref:Uncharacterized protein n=1 Tax=Lasiosphaeris hirsuta TaxID=260670 RepID=A0AA40DX09_9PEZI|nr:hypothetical protein B0H67DRAFT_225137 [Lasiosphaeris hirsuta]